MTRRKCPYCNGSTLVPSVDGTRPRPDTLTVLRCADCSAYCVESVLAGGVFPLNDRTDPDGDPVTRVIDV